MRIDFVKSVKEEVASDDRAVFLTGDLGYSALEEIAASLGPRFINAGVAEQNMIGVAAGLALSGQHAWVYSIAPFLVYRALEQIRNDVCLHNLPVRFVGNGGGYTYGIMGSTHHALEDFAVLKSLPNMTLYFPCTGDHVAAAVKQMSKLESPAYLRLAISGFPSARTPLSENPETLTRHYHRGTKVTLIGVGHAVQVALSALEQSSGKMGEVDVFGVAKFPLDPDRDVELGRSIRKTKKLIVLDEHYLPGSIAESVRIAYPDLSSFEVICAKYSKDQRYGSARFHLGQSGLTPERVVKTITSLRGAPSIDSSKAVPPKQSR